MQDVLQNILGMLMLETLEGRFFEDLDMKHCCDMGFPQVIYYDKEMIQVVLHMEMALVKKVTKCIN